MDIISIVNTMQPNTISRFALKATDFPNGGNCIPFMNGFVQLFPNATLPDPAAVIAYESVYNATIASAKISAQALAELPDLPTRLANVEAAIVTLGGSLPEAQITAANNTLTAIGQSTISIQTLKKNNL